MKKLLIIDKSIPTSIKDRNDYIKKDAKLSVLIPELRKVKIQPLYINPSKKLRKSKYIIPALLDSSQEDGAIIVNEDMVILYSETKDKWSTSQITSIMTA